MVRGLLAALALLALAAVAGLPSGARAGDQVWVVQPGDVLGSIARRFGVSVDTLKSWNQLESDRIRVGQSLVVARDVAEPLPAAPPAPPPRMDGPVYKVRSGDTLARVARRFGTTADELRRWNAGITPNRIRVGQELRIPEMRKRVLHVVRRGEGLRDVAERYQVETRELRLWNEKLGATLRMGQELVVFSDAPPSRSESIGLPYRGQLRDATRLLPHPGYVIRDPQRSYGTEETVHWLYEAFDYVQERLGGGNRVRVHDISHPKGGFMRGHASHQSGRDVDLSLYRKRCKDRVCAFVVVRPEELDAERQWALLSHILKRGRAEAVFLDYSLQRPLYEQAKREGATEAQLREWFQYPRGETHPKGVVRHYRNHRDHAHVRFVCHKTDAECVPR